VSSGRNVLDPELQEQRLLRKIRECRETKFYGTVTLYMQAGNLLRFETSYTELLSQQEESHGVASEEGQPEGGQVQEALPGPEQAGQAGA
jgi:hypothetical protein